MGLGLDSPSHWVVIAVIALLLFGYKKLPDMARSAGKSLRIFKTEMKGMADDDDVRTAAKDAAPQASAVQPSAAPASAAQGSVGQGSAGQPSLAAPAALPAPNGDVPVAQAPAPVTTAAVTPNEVGTESAPPRPS